MIVKNEEGNLQRCLDSFLPIINMRDDETLEPQTELIVIDTGSTDRTVNVAKKYTDKVYQKEFIPWDFSAARNESIKYAKGEKILIVDADEELPREGVYGLMNIILNPQYDQYPSVFFFIRSLYNNDGEYTEFKQARLFKNDGEFHYEGGVHNKPILKTPYLYIENIYFLHYGYLFQGNPELKKKKYERSLPLLLESHEKDPHDTHALTHLVKTYKLMDQWDEVIKYGEMWIVEMKKIKESGDFHEGWFGYLESFPNIIEGYLQKKDIESVLRVKADAEEFSKRITDLYATIGFYYMGKDESTAAWYLERVVEILKTKGSDYEELLNTNIKMSLVNIYNFLARYYFMNGYLLRSGQYMALGIHANKFNKPLRWDFWNYKNDSN